MKINFVLIDFENVQPRNLGLLTAGLFKIKIFLGANQSKIPLATARALHALGADAEYIQIEGNGSNALDFHIAYYIGKLAVEFPESFFHIVSKDTGFDPLIKHLKANKILCKRSTSITDIPLIKISNSKSGPERADAVIDNLVKRQASKPRTLKTLSSSIKALFINQATDEEVSEVIKQLTQRGAVTVTDGKVSYQLP